MMGQQQQMHQRQQQMSNSQPQQYPGFEAQLSLQQHQQNMQQYKNMQQSQQHETDVDDSGICMGMMDDDLAFSKYSLAGGHDMVGNEIGVNVI